MFPRDCWKWRVTLASDFVTLETWKYSSRDEFLGRLDRVLRALHEHVNPRVVDRVGIRYIDRIKGADSLAALPRLVQPAIAGILGTPLANETKQTIAESVFASSDQWQLTARWGLLPAQVTTDPSTIDPIPDPSWILDLDAFELHTRPFEPSALVQRARFLAERIYGFFRWAVEDEFLRYYGGAL